MDNVDSVWQISFISLFAGVLIGALAYRLLSPSVKRIDEVESDLSKAREEMANYKTSVNQHFNKTSELVNDLTQNYVKVYQHLADGAQSLGDIGTLNNLLEQSQGKVSIAVSDEAKTREPILETEPIEVAPIEVVPIEETPSQAESQTENQDTNEEIEQSLEPEENETGPKDYDDGSVIAQTSEPESKDGDSVENADLVDDLDSANASSDANNDSSKKQNNEDTAASTLEENDPETIEPDKPATKKT